MEAQVQPPVLFLLEQAVLAAPVDPRKVPVVAVPVVTLAQAESVVMRVVPEAMVLVEGVVVLAGAGPLLEFQTGLVPAAAVLGCWGKDQTVLVERVQVLAAALPVAAVLAVGVEAVQEVVLLAEPMVVALAADAT